MLYKLAARSIHRPSSPAGSRARAILIILSMHIHLALLLSSPLNMDKTTKTSPPSKLGFNRGSWTAAEDKILLDYVAAHGVGKWGKVPKTSGLNRCPRSCRHRWLNYLRPDIKRGNISEDEEALILRLHNLLGNRWSLIAGRLPGRTDNEIKNYWNTVLKKKMALKSDSGSSTGMPGTNTTKCKSDSSSFSKAGGRGKECTELGTVSIGEDKILDDSFSLSIDDRDVFEQLASLETEGLWPRGIFDFEFSDRDAGIWEGDDYACKSWESVQLIVPAAPSQGY